MNKFKIALSKEKEITISGEDLKKLIQFNPDICCLTDTDWNIKFANKKFIEQVNIPLNEIRGLNISEIFSYTEYKKLERAKQSLLEGEEVREVEIEIKRSSGNTQYFDINSIALKEKEKITSFLSVAQNISKRKRSNLRLENAMKAGKLAWWEMELPSGKLDFNERKAKMLGYSPEQFQHFKDFTDLLHPDDYNQAMQAMRDHLEGKAKRYKVDYRIKMKSGQYKWFRDVGAITEEIEQQNYKKVTGIVIDIDDQKNAELREEQILERTNFYKDLLAHDIANILNNIQASIQLAEMQQEKDKKLELDLNTMKMIKKQVQRGISLISNVRKLSRMENQIDKSSSENLIPILQNAIAHIRSQFSKEELEIQTEFPSEDIKVRGGELLIDAFENILLNGCVHNQSERIKLKLIVSKVKNDECQYAKIEFIDNGVGISKERKKTIFQRDKEIDQKSKGMGIGLSLVNAIINGYNGEIWVENRVKDDYTQGSKFIILLEMV